MATLRELQDQLFNRVNPLVEFPVRRYVLAVGFFVAVLVFGVISSSKLGVDLMPSVSIPIVSIQTTWSGATPAVIDEQVTQIIESSVSTLAGITDINSSSSAGSSRVTVSLEAGVDKNAAINQISSRVSAVTRRLPTGVNTPTVQSFDPNQQAILQFGVSAPGVPMEDLGDWVSNDFAPLIERVQGVANVTIDGVPTRQYQVILDPNLLQYYKLNPQQVSTAITSSAVNQPIGTITANSSTITFTSKNQPKTVENIESILVDGTRGLTVGSLARVRQIPVPASFIRVNGQPSVLVSIQKSTDGNSVAVAKAVRDFLDKAGLPQGYKVTISNDTTGPILASIDNTFHELFLTALVVAIICLLFLGRLNTALSVILAVPIALAASPILYTLLGFTFNLVSLLAMVVAIGIVVDDSIVVSENVTRYRALGYSLRESVLKGASEVFSAVVAASLSLLSVLIPVSFLGGPIGQYLMQFSLGLAAAVFFSLVEAVLFLTVRLAYTPESKEFTFQDFVETWGLFPKALKWGLTAWKSGVSILAALAAAVGLLVLQQPWWIIALVGWPLYLTLGWFLGRLLLTGLQALTTFLHNLTEAGVDWVREAYANSLGGVLKWAPWILGGALVLFVSTEVFIQRQIPFNLVPQTDAGTLSANVRLPQGTPASVSNEAAGRVENWLMGQPEVATVQTVVSSGGASGFGGQASLTVVLVPIEHRRSSFVLAQAYRQALTPLLADMPSARVNVNAGGFGGGGFGGQGSSISLTMLSSDFDSLTAVNDAAIDALQNYPQVADVSSSLSNTNLENVFVPDPDRLKGTGLAPNTVAQVLQTYASGTQAGSVQAGGKSYPIQVLLDPSRLQGTQSLLDLPIYAPSLQTTLSAGQLGSFVLTPAPASLNRTNRQYSATLTVSLNPGGPPVSVFQKQVTDELTAQGILGQKVSLGNEGRNSFQALTSQLASQAFIAFGLAVFLAYLVMGAQFNSWRYPLYLLLPVPLALAGAQWFVFFSGSGLDIFGVLGMLLLIGLSAKNAILYLDFVVERLDVMPLHDALVESARLRFRPIVMTTLTVMVISFPLIFSAGQGAEFGQKLGIVILGGVLTSAVLTFFVVPCAFWLFERRRHQEKVLGLGKDEPIALGDTPGVTKTGERA